MAQWRSLILRGSYELYVSTGGACSSGCERGAAGLAGLRARDAALTKRLRKTSALGVVNLGARTGGALWAGGQS